MTAYTVHKIANTLKTQYFTEPLEGLGDALSLDMVLVSAGRFVMGSPDDEPGWRESEGPQHEVTLPSFFMGRYPVTQAQWRAVAALEKAKIELDPDPSNFKGANLPVEQVSWYEAVEFCERLKKHTKRPYRLPSEADGNMPVEQEQRHLLPLAGHLPPKSLLTIIVVATMVALLMTAVLPTLAQMKILVILEKRHLQITLA